MDYTPRTIKDEKPHHCSKTFACPPISTRDQVRVEPCVMLRARIYYQTTRNEWLWLNDTPDPAAAAIGREWMIPRDARDTGTCRSRVPHSLPTTRAGGISVLYRSQ